MTVAFGLVIFGAALVWCGWTGSSFGDLVFGKQTKLPTNVAAQQAQVAKQVGGATITKSQFTTTQKQAAGK